MNQTETLFSIKIIRINNAKGAMYLLSALHQGMGSPPGFRSTLRHGKTLGECCDFLKNIVHIRNFLDSFSDNISEILLNILSNDKNQLLEACFQSIMHGIIHDNLPIRANFCQLFNPRTVTGSKTRCHDYQRCIFSHLSLPSDGYCMKRNAMYILLLSLFLSFKDKG